jgi:hypothetical protein
MFPLSCPFNSGLFAPLLRLEKQATAGSEPVWRQAGFVLPGHVQVLRDLGSLENALFQFLLQRGLSANPERSPAQNPAPGAVPLPLPESNPSALPAAKLSPESLPTLILRVLEQKGGLDFLTAQIAKLQPQSLRPLVASMAALDPPKEPEAQRRFLALMQGFRRALSQADQIRAEIPAVRSTAPQAPPRPEAGRELMRYLRPTPGADLFLGRGLIVERTESGTRAPVSGTASPAVPAGTPEANSPLRYRIDLGGAMLEAFSAERRMPGDFVTFHLERDQGRLWIRFRDGERSLPPELRPAYAAADAPGKAALLLSADFLGPALDKPGFVAAARDFAALLSDTGRLQGSKPDLPSPDELDVLFRLMLAFPKDAANPGMQARVWGEAVRQDGGLASFLRLLRPAESAPSEALLRPDSILQTSPRLAEKPENPAQEAVVQALRAASGGTGELRWENLFEAARTLATPEAARGETARPALAGVEKFLLQALVGMGPRDDDWPETQVRNFQFYQGNAWQGSEASWSKVQDSKTRSFDGSKRPPVRMDITVRGQNLGQVEVNLVLDAQGSRLQFRNEFHDARNLLARYLPPLERLLEDLDLRLLDWSYARLPTASSGPSGPEFPTVAPGPRPNLDLFG